MKEYNPIYATFLVALGFGINACKSDGKSDEKIIKSIPVTTDVVRLSVESQDISVSGTIEGDKTVKLGFMVAGKIDKIGPKEGQIVRKGQLLATLDPSNYSLAKQAADVQANQAKDEYNRLKLMRDRNSLSESDFKKIDFTLQGAEVQQKLQSKNLADTRLYAPISGILLKKLAEPGEIIGAGAPMLVIAAISNVNVNAYIPENQINQIRIGQPANVYIGALGKTVIGTVTEVGGVADEVTRAFTVKIDLANPNHAIRPGMIAAVKLASPEWQTVLSVPASAILRTPEGQSYVFVADKTNGQAFQRNISVGRVSANKIQIVSGLTEGEVLVTGGQHKLTNGSKISITTN